jgi:hypothetical protein
MTNDSDDDGGGDYWLVYVRPDNQMRVATEVGEWLADGLRAGTLPAIVELTTLAGSRMVYRRDAIEGAASATQAERARYLAHRDREEKAERSPVRDDDEPWKMRD